MTCRIVLCSLVAGLMLSVVAITASAQDKVFTKDGFVQLTPYPVAAEFRNAPWPDTLERGFWERCNHAIDALKGKTCSNTYFENEKSSYPHAFAKFISGNRTEAIKCLEGEDANANEWNQHTLGIDYFPCFTLKGQMRKYFWFGTHGGYLNSVYKQRMFDAGKIWTEQDPETRLHPLHGAGNGEYGYTPVNRGYWVDRRMTDNLRAMRETSVYLMAEETGNDTIRKQYKDKIIQYVRSLYHIGMGEWDSENYHGHTIAPYLNLYDFAKDPEVKMLGKAALDWLMAAGALKYWRGGFGGPCARDYGNAGKVFGPLVSHKLAIYFGEIPFDDPNPYYDDVFPMMSAYRPPAAVLGLAGKQFPRPVELLNTKPYYSSTRAGYPSDKPQFYETIFWGRTYMLGTVVSDTNGNPWDISPCKLMTGNDSLGVDFIIPFTSSKAPEGKFNTKKTGDQIAQYRNLMIYLRRADSSAFYFLIPKSVGTEVVDGIWFFRLEKTWIAIRPINLQPYAVVATALDTRYPDGKFITAKPSGSGYAGFTMEIGEQPDHSTYDQFKQNVRTKNKTDISKLVSGIVLTTGTDNATLELTYNTQTNPSNDLPGIKRNGVAVDYSTWLDLYKPVTGDAPISLGWKKGTLQITAGNTTFTQTVTADGKVTSVPVKLTSRKRNIHSAERPKMALSRSQLSIKAPEGTELFHVKLFRIDGKVVVSRKISGNSMSITGLGFSSGTLICEVESSAGSIAKKLIRP